MNPEDIQKKITELENAFQDIKKVFQAHQHTSLDGSSQTEGGPDLKAATISLSGGAKETNSVASAAINIYDTNTDVSTPKRVVSEQIYVLNKNASAEIDEMAFSVGKSDTPTNPYDFTKFNLSQLTVQHYPQDVNTPPYSFFTGIRSPYFVSTGPTGTIIQNNSILTDTSLTLIPSPAEGSLAGCRLNLYDAKGDILEGWVIASNTATTITIAGAFISQSGIYSYIVYDPMFLGSADFPWRRLYLDNEGGEAIRFGQGPTGGTQTIGLFYGSGNPNGYYSANPGSFFLSSAGGAGTTLYVKESGVILSPSAYYGWVPYGGGATSINGTAWGNISSIPSGLDTLVSLPTLEFSNGITFSSSTFTIVTAGQYLVTGIATYTSSVTGKEYQTEIWVNGLAVAKSYFQAAGTAGAIGPCVTRIVNLNVGDHVQLYTWQSTGSSESLYNASSLTYLSIAKV